MNTRDIIEDFVTFIESNNLKDFSDFKRNKDEEIIDILIENDIIDTEDIIDDLIEHMNKWRKEHHNYYYSSEIFWKEFFKEVKEQLL